MGSRAYLTLGELTLAWTKGEIDPTILLLFSETDRQVISDDINPDDDSEDRDNSCHVEYSSPLGLVKDRLDAMGYSIDGIREIFEIELRHEIEEKEKYFPISELSEIPDWSELNQKELDVLKSLNFDSWVSALKFIIDNHIRPESDIWYGHIQPDHPGHTYPRDVQYILGGLHGSGYLWFPSYDYRLLLRVLAESVALDTKLIYDISELVDNGYVELEEDLFDWATRTLAQSFEINSKILILTEGSSDIFAISESLNILYPHLSNLYSFMDFSTSKAQGGAPALAQTLKVFCGAGIANRIIAIFDNDTAAKSALRALGHLKYPDNIRVIQLPELEMARNYPTLGPQGLTNLDINGLAGGIELYYGVDVLSDHDGNLTPVQWKGYDESTMQYQGELTHKAEIQKRFAKKIEQAKLDPPCIPTQDWSSMQKVIKKICSAFNYPKYEFISSHDT